MLRLVTAGSFEAVIAPHSDLLRALQGELLAA
jgi:hypothetical protein